MVQTDAALALIGISFVVALLLLIATIYVVPTVLPSGDHAHEEHEHEGNERSAGGPVA